MYNRWSEDEAPHAEHDEVVRLLVDSGSDVNPQWLAKPKVRADMALSRRLRAAHEGKATSVRCGPVVAGQAVTRGSARAPLAARRAPTAGFAQRAGTMCPALLTCHSEQVLRRHTLDSSARNIGKR
jgi:hypothetical protein